MFKDKPVNHDPREVFIGNLHAEHGQYNVFRRTLLEAPLRRLKDDSLVGPEHERSRDLALPIEVCRQQRSGRLGQRRSDDRCRLARKIEHDHDPRAIVDARKAEHVAFRAERFVSAFGQCTMRSPKRNQAPVEADDGLWVVAEQVDITSHRIVGEA